MAASPGNHRDGQAEQPISAAENGAVEGINQWDADVVPEREGQREKGIVGRRVVRKGAERPLRHGPGQARKHKTSPGAALNLLNPA